MNPVAQDACPSLVLTLDALNTAFLGPYGNTWLSTPGWNQLAAQSLLFEQAMATTTDLPAAFAEVWGTCQGDVQTLPAQLREQGTRTQFWTDDHGLADMARSAEFDSVCTLRSENVTVPAKELEQTRLFSQTLEIVARIESQGLAGLTWIHLTALLGPWDAPMEMRAALFDEELGDPPAWIEPQPRSSGQPLDADELLRWQVAYGAQMQVLDFCLQYLQQAFDDMATDGPRSLIVAAPRGCPVGAHGNCLDMRSLWTECVQIPLMVSVTPDLRCLRAQQLTSWSDIGPTVLELAGAPSHVAGDSLLRHANHPNRPGRDRLLIRGGQETALRTEQWLLRCPSTGSAELYVKPDDRHDVNEVAQRLPAVTEQLIAIHAELASASPLPEPKDGLPIPERPTD